MVFFSFFCTVVFLVVGATAVGKKKRDANNRRCAIPRRGKRERSTISAESRNPFRQRGDVGWSERNNPGRNLSNSGRRRWYILIYAIQWNLISLSVYTPKKEPPFHFMTFRDVIGVAPRLSVRTSGRPKDHGDSSQPSTSFVFLEFCFFGEILNCDQHNYPRSTLVTPLPRWPHPNFLYLWSPFSLSY